MRRAVRTGAGPVRGCGALRGGRRRQKRASRGLPVGAAQRWPRDWLRYSRVRRLLGSGRAPRPRARRPLTTRYVLALRLRCGARGFRAPWRRVGARVPRERRWRWRFAARRSEHLRRPARRRLVSAPPAPAAEPGSPGPHSRRRQSFLRNTCCCSLFGPGWGHDRGRPCG